MRNWFFVLFFLIVSFMASANDSLRPRLIYVADPLCGWCYAFGEEVGVVYNEFKDSVDFELVMGGMVRSGSSRSNQEIKGFLSKAIPVLEKKTGVMFGDEYYTNYLDSKDTIYMDSELASRVVLYLDSVTNIGVSVLKKVQDLLYVKGLNISDSNSYVGLFNSINEVGGGVSIAECKKVEFDRKMKNSFLRAQQLGVSGYPCLLFEYGGRVEVICYGYSKSEKLVKLISKKINSLK